MNAAANPTAVIEVFCDVCCPFSKKIFDTLTKMVRGGVSQRESAAPEL